MRVRELIEHLSRIDAGLDVLGISDDENLTADGREFLLFEVENVRTATGERSTRDDGRPFLQIAKQGQRVALLSINSEF